MGCATGYTLVKLYNAGFRNIFGVDTSTRMIGRAKVAVQSLDTDPVKNLFLSEIPTALPSTLFEDEEKVDAALVNWTFHTSVCCKRRCSPNLSCQHRSANEIWRSAHFDREDGSK